MKTIDEMLDEVAKIVSAPKAPKPVQNTSVKTAQSKPVITKSAAQKKIESMPFYDKLTLSFAKEIAYAVEQAAESMGLNVVIAIDDEGANLTLLHSMDDAYIASLKIAQDKAYTAVALKMTTAQALEMSRGGALDGLTNGNGIMLLGGGEPLKAGGKIFGGIGVSGGTKEQDIMLAHLGATYFEHRIKI